MAELNLATFMIASSAVFGKLISISAVATIFYRCLLAAAFIYLIARFFRVGLQFDVKRHWRFFISGAFFLVAHWVTYYMAIRTAGVAVAMLSMFTYPIVTTLLEPLYFKSSFSKFNLLSSLGIVIGIAFLVPDFDLNNPITLGVGLGIISALFYSIRNLLSKKYIEVYSGTSIMFYQMLMGSILLSPLMLIQKEVPLGRDLALLLGLSLMATAIGHTMFVRSLKYFSTSTASIISSVQPVYGIILAALVTDEKNKPIVFIGGAIILVVVILQSLRQTLKTR